MRRFVRFVVHQRIKRDSRRIGLFTAANSLRESGELFDHDREWLETLLEWFNAELTLPPKDKIQARAIFWYRNVGPFSGKMWELAQVLNAYDLTVEMMTARVIGYVVYKDEYQAAALPPRRRRR